MDNTSGSTANAFDASYTSPGIEYKPRLGSEAICEALLDEGVDYIFGYPGGTIMPFYDALPDYPLRHVLTRHEQAAAHAADGYARATGRVGVCVATSGPGATNLVTGLATAKTDSVPLVALTGQVGRPVMGKDSFQETDVMAMAMPFTKHSFLVEDPDELYETMRRAFEIARSGRPGPVLVDVPKDVQLAACKHDTYRRLRAVEGQAESPAVAAAAMLLKKAKRPVIIAGHGVTLSGAERELMLVAERVGAPIVTTLLGLSAVPEDHPLYIGWPGMHGQASVNRAVDKADLVFGVGMRFDDRITGNAEKWAPNAKIVHIDIDPSELGKVKRPTVGIPADAKSALRGILRHLEDARDELAEWRAEIEESQRPERARVEGAKDEYGPIRIMEAIKATAGEDVRLVTDVGQHQMWAAQFFRFTKRNSHITSGGHGTMGFALPAAMGVALAYPDEPVWVVAGDGGFQMNIQEFATIRDLGLNIKVAILNNGYLGMVRQWQQFFHNRRYSETPMTGPDYEQFAKAYGVAGRTVHPGDDVEEAVKWAQSQEGLTVVDFHIDPEANVYPMIPSGMSINEIIEEHSV
ncbi:biosynthetic-type acetolactate synthase large subunit [Rubrobacter radiotolerans]|uniref:Acetolactate synthase n=1 Tax=Rubrobacter radiotolerans TaxID=42256 RepID=A0AB35SZJ1_RUBRA|nr:biosynthetic-type acetolactate synthase large subunit [Rubrobacter radiotolerans]MDX5892915.1 biosynthetic-type acetolactate synthase large subunit [Rubrobacter radiotolerans]